MTADPATIDEALGAASFHTFYRSSGSSFTAALDSVLHFVEPGRGDLQAVLLSDGEQPFDELFDEPLAALEEAGVPVHTVAIGSREGQTRLIFDFRDVVAGKEEKTVLREYTTRREDRHLKRIARGTDGRFTRADGRAAEEVAAAIERRIAGAHTVRAEGWRDLSGVPLTLFLVGFLLEALVFGRRPKRPDLAFFDIDRLGKGRPAAAAGLALLVTAALATLACRDNSPLGRASRENERGIAADALESWPQARVHYDRSRAFGVRPEIPAFNLARSVTLQGDWSEAHDLYQRALELAPQLAVGHYNDGHVLYRWGESELDLESCELERTLELWNAASRRFAGAAELFEEEDAGRAQALDNLRFIGERITLVEEACAPPPPPPASGGGASEGQSEEQSGGEGESESESESENQDEGESGDGGEQQGESEGGGEQQGESEGGGEQQGESEGGGEQQGESEGGGSAGGRGEGDDGDDDGEQQEGEGGGQGDDDAEAGDEGEQQGGAGGEGDDQGDGGDEGQDEGEGGGGEEGEDEGERGGEGEDEGQDGGEGEDEGERGGEGEDGDEGESGGEGERQGEAGDNGEHESEGGPGEGEGDGEGGGGAGTAPLTGDELEQIRQALARIGEERFADGHYRSLPEQFPREVWQNPEAEIWW
jgi:tetratricopeptide (TPR) repeat protein